MTCAKKIRFTKMVANGNDFIICDVRSHGASFDLSKLSHAIADRHFGVGSDQILFLTQAQNDQATMRVFNADGSEAEMSGNGVRTFTKFLFDEQIITHQKMTIHTLAGLIKPEIVSYNQEGQVLRVRVDMGPAQSYQHQKLKSDAFRLWDRQLLVEHEGLAEDEIWVHHVSMGNPHAVVFVRDVNEVPLDIWGPRVETHAYFPQRTNFEVAQIVNPYTILQRTWERGAGETLACGTGACAVAKSYTMAQGRQTEGLELCMRGGKLDVFENEGHWVQVGDAHLICQGEYSILEHNVLDVSRGDI